MPHLRLMNKQTVEQEFAQRQLLTCLKETPADWPYDSRLWYKGTISADELRRVWVVCTTWTEGTWLSDVAAMNMTIGLAERRWAHHPVGGDYDRIEMMVEDYRNNPSDECRWAILKDDMRSGTNWLVVDDGNHRAIASVLAACADIAVWVVLHPENGNWLI